MKHFLLIAVLIITFRLCNDENTLHFNLSKHNTLRINLGTEPPTIDWSKATDTSSSFITTNIMEGLTQFDFTDGINMKPALATSWTSSDSQNWVFNIRKGVLWSDGVELTAQHFIEGWERVLNPLTASQYANYLYTLVNAKEYNEGKLTDFTQVGIKAVDKYTLHIQLKTPMAYFPKMLAHSVTFPNRADVISKYGDDKWARASNIVTLGAYYIHTWKHDEVMYLKRNENYYQPAKIEHVLVYMLKEHSVGISMIDTEALDVQFGLPKIGIQMIKQRSDYHSTPNLGISFIGINTSKAPYNDAAFRQALAYAIDRSEIIKILGDSGETATNNLIPPGLLGHDESIGITFDVDKARDILTKAGYDLNNMPTISYSYNADETNKMMAENLQAQLKRNLNIRVKLYNEEWKAYLNTLKTNNYGLYRMG